VELNPAYFGISSSPKFGKLEFDFLHSMQCFQHLTHSRLHGLG
jgi:hypothetical protein